MNVINLYGVPSCFQEQEKFSKVPVSGKALAKTKKSN
jgi:hypothetical protein